MSQVFISGRPRQSKEVFFNRPRDSSSAKSTSSCGQARDDASLPEPRRTASTAAVASVKTARPGARKRTNSDGKVIAAKTSQRADARRHEVDPEEETEDSKEAGVDLKGIIGGIAGLGAVAASAAFAPALLPLTSMAARSWIGDGGANAISRLAGAGIDAIAGKKQEPRASTTDDDRFSVLEDDTHPPQSSAKGKQMVRTRT